MYCHFYTTIFTQILDENFFPNPSYEKLGVWGWLFRAMKLGKYSKSSNLVARLEDFTSLYLEIQVFWDVTLGQWFSGSESFEGVFTFVGPLERCRSRQYTQSASNHNR